MKPSYHLENCLWKMKNYFLTAPAQDKLTTQIMFTNHPEHHPAEWQRFINLTSHGLGERELNNLKVENFVFHWTVSRLILKCNDSRFILSHIQYSQDTFENLKVRVKFHNWTEKMITDWFYLLAILSFTTPMYFYFQISRVKNFPSQSWKNENSWQPF